MEGWESARAIRDAVIARRVSAVDVCRDALDRIAEVDGQVHAFLTVSRESALARAASLDARTELVGLPLAGVPVAIKDNICTRGTVTSAGSRMLEGYRPPYDAALVERLDAAGAIVVGKTNCDEFAMGSSTENSAFGPTRNPWNLDRIPGGSSGGSAAAVAAGMVPIAFGSDTGGSIRQPAALCGTVGFKPTYGRVSRYGLLAFASSLDQIGPFASTVEDAAIAFGVIAGHDPRDATSRADAAADEATGPTDPRNLRVGIPRALLAEGIEPGVLAAFDAAVAVLEARGASIVDVALPHSRYAIPVYYIVATAEASANLARYDGVRYGARVEGARSIDEMYERSRGAGFGAEVKRRIVLGTYVLSAGYYEACYRKAQDVRRLVAADFRAAFAGVDLIALPTSPTAAFAIGERTGDPLRMYLADVFTVSANLAGLPAVSVPCGFTEEGLPVGLQLIGPAMRDEQVLGMADVYQRATSWTDAHPAIRRG